MCFVWISEQTAIISLYSIQLQVIIVEAESVSCAVRTGASTQSDVVLSFKGLMRAVGSGAVNISEPRENWLFDSVVDPSPKDINRGDLF